MGKHIAHEEGRLAPLLAALEHHPARAPGAGAQMGARGGDGPHSHAVTPPLPASFFTSGGMTPQEVKAKDSGWRTKESEFAAGIAGHDLPPPSALASALMHMARAGRMADEGGWTAMATAVARMAHNAPADAHALYDALDSASQVAGGNYQPEENRKRFDRFVKSAGTRPGYDHRTITNAALAAGWRWSPPIAAPLPSSSAGHNSHGPQVMGAPAGGGRGIAVPVTSLPAIPPKRLWLHGTDIVRGAVTLVVAPGGRGKTGLLVGIALACATGKPLMAAHVSALPGGLRVLYVNNEDGRNEIALRARAAIMRHGLSDSECRNLFVAGADDVTLTLLRTERGEAKADEAGWTRLEAMIAARAPDVLILDPLANLSAASLNDNHAATMLMGRLTRLAVQHHMGIVVAHHTAKGRDLSSQEAASGAAAIVNSARISLALEPLAASEATKLGVMPSEADRVFSIGHVKANLAPAAERRWFRMESITIANATPPIYPHGDNVQVVVPFTPNPAADVFPLPILQAAVEAVAAAQPPLSPKATVGGRSPVPPIARAIAPFLPGMRAGVGDTTAKAVLAELVRRGWIAEEDVRIPKAGGGTNPRKGYVVKTNPLPALASARGSDAQAPSIANTPTNADGQGGTE
jgi:hypothetical protein